MAAGLLVSGCASIVSGQNQSLSVLTKNDGADAPGAACSLTNDKGSWYVTSPGSVTVHRSFKDLSVNCALGSDEPGIATVKSSTKGMAFGNILFGGVIGAGVDVATGAAYDYPDVIVVTLGQRPAASGAPTASPSPSASPSSPASGAMASPVTVLSSPRQAAADAPVRRYTVDAKAGLESVVRSHASWDERCGSRPTPTITWIDMPKNGATTVRDEVVSARAAGSDDEACSGKDIKGLRVYYQPDVGFHGKEELAYRVDSGAGRGEVRVTVRVE